MPTTARLIGSTTRGPESTRRVFTWRNFLRRAPRIDVEPTCPLQINDPRYYSFASLGSRVGTLLRFSVVKTSSETVHSYTWRHSSPVLFENGAYGVHPEHGLASGRSQPEACHLGQRCPLTLTTDFVQFADGSTWFSTSDGGVVQPVGVEAGARAAATYLLEVLEREGSDAVLRTLPRIHADVPDPLPTAGTAYGIRLLCGRDEHSGQNQACCRRGQDRAPPRAPAAAFW